VGRVSRPDDRYERNWWPAAIGQRRGRYRYWRRAAVVGRIWTPAGTRFSARIDELPARQQLAPWSARHDFAARAVHIVGRGAGIAGAPW